MDNKKSYILTIIVTALAASLLTNAMRDINYARMQPEAVKKISVVGRMLTEYSLFPVDEQKAADYASMAMAVAVDDPYTAYFPKEEFSSYRDNLVSSYVGMGAMLGADTNSDALLVVSVMEDSPAERAGLMPYDIIKSIDGEVYGASRLTEAAIYLKNGEVGTKVSLSVERDGKEIGVEITRDEVNKKSVSTKMVEDEIGYMRISGFESKVSSESKNTYDEFKENLEALKNAGMKKLIIDLRDNPGGDLDVVCKIADDLLPKGLITYTEDKSGKRTTVNSDERELDMPMAVIVNGRSASASEVLTGALKDHKKATVIGTRTYGKGIVQTVFPFSDGSGMSITTAKYYTPSGVCIHQIGIEPDIEVNISDDKPVSSLTNDEDIQLKKAIEVLK